MRATASQSNLEQRLALFHKTGSGGAGPLHQHMGHTGWKRRVLTLRLNQAAVPAQRVYKELTFILRFAGSGRFFLRHDWKIGGGGGACKANAVQAAMLT